MSYSTSDILATARNEFGGEDKNAKKIVAAVDDFCHSSRGQAAIDNLLVCGSSEGDEAKTFREECERYVRREVFGSGIFSFIAWMAVRWLVSMIIEHYIDQILAGEE